VDKLPSPLGWIPESIEEATDGASRLVPILQSNFVGTMLLIGLLATTTFCAVTLIVICKDPQPLDRFNHAQYNNRDR
jgi:hypothetical protein